MPARLDSFTYFGVESRTGDALDIASDYCLYYRYSTRVDNTSRRRA